MQGAAKSKTPAKTPTQSAAGPIQDPGLSSPVGKMELGRLAYHQYFEPPKEGDKYVPGTYLYSGGFLGEGGLSNSLSVARVSISDQTPGLSACGPAPWHAAAQSRCSAAGLQKHWYGAVAGVIHDLWHHLTLGPQHTAL